MKNLYICSSKILTNIVETLRKQKKKKNKVMRTLKEQPESKSRLLVSVSQEG